MSKKIGLILSIVVALFLAYNLLGQILNTLKQGDRLQQANEALHSLEARNKELKKKLSDAQRPEFIEQQARDKLGLAKDGETVVVIPQEEIQKVLGIQKTESAPPRLPNWQGWLRLFGVNF